MTDDGSATFNANFEPVTALVLKNDLMQILNKGIVLSSHFHLLYAIVPPEITVNIDWNIFHNEVCFIFSFFCVKLYFFKV